MKTNHFGGCFKLGSVIISLSLLCLTQTGAATTGLETWKNTFSVSGRTPPVQVQKLAVSDHRFVAVAPEGQYLYSDDGVLWTNSANSIFSGPVVGLAAGGGMFVTAAASSIYSSADGIHWTNYPFAQGISTPHLRDLVYGNGLFVALGSRTVNSTNHTFLTSSEGVNWQRKDVPLTARMIAIAAGQGHFVGIGNEGTVWNSNDGASWTEVTHVPAALSDCAYGDGWFVAVGDRGTVAISDDGSHWRFVASGFSRDIAAIRFAGGIFYAASSGEPLFEFEIQTDGQIDYLVATGSARVGFGANSVPTDVVYDLGRYVAVGSYSGRLYPAIWSSSDGINWNIVTGFQGSPEIHEIAVAGHRYFAFGDAPSILSWARSSFVLSSTDLISWQRSDSTADPSSRTGYIGFGDEVFAFEGPRIVASTDGLRWDVRYVETDFLSPRFAIDSTTKTLISWGGLSSSNAIVATTRDGVVWQRHSVASFRSANLIAAGNNIVVGVSSTQSYTTTTLAALDLATDFLVQTIDTNLNVYAIAYGNGIFVAVGTISRDGVQGVSLVSRDGQTWQRNDAPTVTGMQLFNAPQLVYANGWFVLRGTYVSADGVTWMKLPNPIAARLVFDGKQIIGTDGTAIFHSNDIIPPSIVNASVLSVDSLRRETDGAVSLQLDGAADQSGAVEVSEDLRTWVPLTSRDNPLSFKDAGAQGRPMRFYRLRPMP